MKWYEKAIPKVKDVMPHINDLCKKIAKSSHVKNVYIFNTLYENMNNPDYRIKDIDILVDCKFDSGDLLAIDNTQSGALKIASNILEDLGYNPNSVVFTKQVLQYKAPSVDFWAISTDNKLLHWGPISDTLEEWKQIKKEAETKTNVQTGYKQLDLIHLSAANRKKWHQLYEKNMNDYYDGCPQGWYSSHNKVENLLHQACKIV